MTFKWLRDPEYKEGVEVRILDYPKRPEFNGKEAELGNFNEKDGTYECWLTVDEFEGSYAMCKAEQFEVIVNSTAPAPAKDETKSPAKDETKSPEKEEASTQVEQPVNNDVGTPVTFAVGDRVRGKESGKEGTVVAVDADGDPKVIIDGETEAKQRFGREFDVTATGSFGVGDRVRGKDSGKEGIVISVDADGDPKVRLDGESEAQQRFGKEFEIIAKASFEVGDRVRGKESRKEGTVVSVDADGDPKVILDGESDAKQRFATEYEIIEKGSERADGEKRSRSRDASESDGGKKGKSKKKKKKKSTSSSSSSESSSSSRHKKKKKRSAFGMSTFEQQEEEKRRAKKFARKHGHNRSSGADAALGLLGLR